MCFEEKECHEEKVCFEDQARQGKRRVEGKKSTAIPRSGSKGKTSPAHSIIRTIIAIIILYVLFGSLARLTRNDVEQESYTDRIYSEPVEIDPVEITPDDETPGKDEYNATMTEEVTMEDGTTFIVWAWEQHDEEQELYLLLETSFAEDSDHMYDAALMCTDASGEEETLVDYTTTWDEDGYLQLHFPTDRYDELYPDFLELQEWDGDNLVVSRIIELW